MSRYRHACEYYNLAPGYTPQTHYLPDDQPLPNHGLVILGMAFDCNHLPADVLKSPKVQIFLNARASTTTPAPLTIQPVTPAPLTIQSATPAATDVEPLKPRFTELEQQLATLSLALGESQRKLADETAAADVEYRLHIKAANKATRLKTENKKHTEIIRLLSVCIARIKEVSSEKDKTILASRRNLDTYILRVVAYQLADQPNDHASPEQIADSIMKSEIDRGSVLTNQLLGWLDQYVRASRPQPAIQRF